MPHGQALQQRVPLVLVGRSAEAENGKIMIQHLVIECLITTPYLPNQLSRVIKNCME